MFDEIWVGEVFSAGLEVTALRQAGCPPLSTTGRHRITRSVWTACGSPPLSITNRDRHFENTNQAGQKLTDGTDSMLVSNSQIAGHKFTSKYRSEMKRVKLQSMLSRRALLFICLLMGILVSGCDPTGLLRVELKLRTPSSESTTVTVDSADTQEALKILDTITAQHDFHLAENESNYIRVYYWHQVPCRVLLTSNGLEVTFGDFGFRNPVAENLFVEARTAFIKKFGKKNVISHRFR